MSTVLRGRNNAFSTDEIVVADKHLRRVLQAMNELGITYDGKGIKRNADLGLALVPLTDYADAARELKETYPPRAEESIAQEDLDTWSDDDVSSEALDAVLRGLRGHFAAKYAGWVPVLAKNRLVANVTGTQGRVTGGGGGSELTMKDAPAMPARAGDAGAGVTVGVVDTKLAEHPWLAGAAISAPDHMLKVAKDLKTGDTGRKIKRPESYPNAASGHATFVAGLILKEAPACVVRVQPALDDNAESSSWTVAEAIVELAKTKPDIINLSLVCYTEDGEPPLLLATAIERVDPRIVIVAAAGNHGDATLPGDVEAPDKDDLPNVMNTLQRKPGWPAALDGVLAVGSAKRAGEPDSFTPSRVGWIDALAVGNDVVSCFPDGHFSAVEDKPDGTPVTNLWHFKQGFARWGGTSFAAAYVTGKIAALTKPASVSPRQALATLLPPRSDDDSTKTGNSDDYQPPFL
jgi:membrane-anchored mycosin MYCP